MPLPTRHPAEDIRRRSPGTGGFPVTFLLDVNALLALRYAAHVHHERVHQWVSRLPAENGRDCAIFATCRITELGFVRVGSGKAGYATNLDSARADLDRLKSRMEMLFIPD